MHSMELQLIRELTQERSVQGRCTITRELQLRNILVAASPGGPFGVQFFYPCGVLSCQQTFIGALDNMVRDQLAYGSRIEKW